MAKTKSGRRKIIETNNKIRLMFILGAVLVLAGIAALVLLPGLQDRATRPENTRSTIPVEVNYPAPELSLQNVNGRTEALKDYRAQVVLVNNWAIWCPPCKAEIPTLEAYYETHSMEGFVIIGIEAGETQKDVLKYVQGHGMTYPVWFDLENAAEVAFKNQGLPSSYVIDHKGTIRLAWIGEISREMLEKFVTPLLNEN